MKDEKKLVIGALCTLMVVMAVGYALLAQQLTINGTAGITSNWQVEITNITEKEKSIGASTNSTNYTATTANFNTSFISPGDYAIYEITVTNKGTLDAIFSSKSLVVSGNRESFIYELNGIKKGDKLSKQDSITFELKAMYNPNVATQPDTVASNLQISLNYQQDIGQNIAYNSYNIGDVIYFAGSNWRVIKSSNEDEDYVTLMKEKVLKSSELGDHAMSRICDANDVREGRNNYYGCTKVNQIIKIDAMAYYWSDTCHWSNYLYSPDKSYTTKIYDGCNNHNDYDGSNIRSHLENDYINILGSQNLKEIDGYKIRISTKEELEELLSMNSNHSLPWIYSDFGENQYDIKTGVNGYWIMTTYTYDTKRAWVLDYRNKGFNDFGVRDMGGVRPVINLLKSAIE